MSKPAVVVGATGTQGGSVVQTLLQSKLYRVRGLTRNVDSPKARKLAQQGVEMVAADLNDEESLVEAFRGATFIYGVTDFFSTFMTKSAEEARAIEEKQGRNIARAAARTGTLEHFIWSTMPNTELYSQGKVVVPHFQGKSEVDTFIRNELSEVLLPKTTFMMVAGYVDNFQWPPFSPVHVKAVDKCAFIQPQDKSTVQPVIGDAAVNVGPFVLGIVNKPEITRGGRTVLATLGFRTTEDMMLSLAECLGKELVYTKIDIDTYDQLFPGWGRKMGLMLQYFEITGKQGWKPSGKEDALITAEDLGLTVGNQLESWKEAMNKKNWKAVFDI